MLRPMNPSSGIRVVCGWFFSWTIFRTCLPFWTLIILAFSHGSARTAATQFAQEPTLGGEDCYVFSVVQILQSTDQGSTARHLTLDIGRCLSEIRSQCPIRSRTPTPRKDIPFVLRFLSLSEKAPLPFWPGCPLSFRLTFHTILIEFIPYL